MHINIHIEDGKRLNSSTLRVVLFYNNNNYLIENCREGGGEIKENIHSISKLTGKKEKKTA